MVIGAVIALNYTLFESYYCPPLQTRIYVVQYLGLTARKWSTNWPLRPAQITGQQSSIFVFSSV